MDRPAAWGDGDGGGGGWSDVSLRFDPTDESARGFEGQDISHGAIRGFPF